VGVLYQEEGTPHFIVRCPLLNGWVYCDCCIAVCAQYFSICLLLWFSYYSTCTILQQMRLMCLYCSTCTIHEQMWLLWLLYCGTCTILQQMRLHYLFMWLILTYMATVVVILQFLHSTLIYLLLWLLYCRLYITFMEVATVVAGTALWLLCMEHMS